MLKPPITNLPASTEVKEGLERLFAVCARVLLLWEAPTPLWETCLQESIQSLSSGLGALPAGSNAGECFSHLR